MDETIFGQIEAAARHLETIDAAPKVAVVLGSGLGAFADTLERSQKVSYAEIPHFPDVHVIGHAGHLVIGDLPGTQIRVAALAGRVHLYEGHSVAAVVHPVRTLARWGVKGIVLTNAAGGINRKFAVGDLMVIKDHLNLTGTNPLVGPNDPRIGTRFPDMSDAYSSKLRARIKSWASRHNVSLQEGVYCGLLGPSYETPAEIRMLQAMGGDAVGMSTVCEVIAANHAGMVATGFSCITNLAAGLGDEPLNHQEVKAAADEARERFVSLLTQGVVELNHLLS